MGTLPSEVRPAPLPLAFATVQAIAAALQDAHHAGLTPVALVMSPGLRRELQEASLVSWSYPVRRYSLLDVWIEEDRRVTGWSVSFL